VNNLDLESEYTDAEILEFLLNQFQMHSPQMNGQHSWRFVRDGFPMSEAKGRTAKDAVIVCMRAQEESTKALRRKYPEWFNDD